MLPQQAIITLYDVLGRSVLTQQLHAGHNHIDAHQLLSGLSFYSIEEKGMRADQGKVWKSERHFVSLLRS